MKRRSGGAEEEGAKRRPEAGAEEPRAEPKRTRKPGEKGEPKRAPRPGAKGEPKRARKPGEKGEPKRAPRPGAKGEPKRARRPGAKPDRKARAKARGEARQRAKARARRSLRATGRRAREAAKPLASVGAELLRIGREMLVIPARLWLAVAEVAGRWVLRAWRLGRPVLLAALGLARRALYAVARRISPAGATVAVTLAAIAALAASQWLELSAISVGTEQYEGVELIAAAPEIESRGTGSAHAWLGLPIAAAALAVVALAVLRKRPALARLLVPLGLVVVAISLLADAPKGLDEGDAAIAYQGAEAELLEGFWVQLVAGTLLVACGALLAHHLAHRPRPAEPGAYRRSLLARLVAGARRAAVAFGARAEALGARMRRGLGIGAPRAKRAPRGEASRRAPRRRPRKPPEGASA